MNVSLYCTCQPLSITHRLNHFVVLLEHMNKYDSGAIRVVFLIEKL